MEYLKITILQEHDFKVVIVIYYRKLTSLEKLKS